MVGWLKNMEFLSDFKGIVDGSGGVRVGKWWLLERGRERLGNKGLIGGN